MKFADTPPLLGDEVIDSLRILELTARNTTKSPEQKHDLIAKFIGICGLQDLVGKEVFLTTDFARLFGGKIQAGHEIEVTSPIIIFGTFGNPTLVNASDENSGIQVAIEPIEMIKGLGVSTASSVSLSLTNPLGAKIPVLALTDYGRVDLDLANL